MNSRSTVLLSLLFAVAAAAGTTWVLQERALNQSPRPIDPARVDALYARLSTLESENNDLRASLDDLRRAVRAGGPVAIRPHVAAAKDGPKSAAEEDALDPAIKTGAPKAPGADAEKLTLEAAIATLGDKKLNFMDRAEVWKKIREAGLTDQVIADFEARVKANPQNPDLQVAVAEAYLKKIEEVGNGPIAGVWADKADKAYDAALATDPEHWAARFSKAIALSFWPPISGKQPEAIRQFETLIGQQANKQPRAEFVQTYVILGNLYNQSGQAAKAADTWRAGLKQFPDNAQLRDLLGPH